MDEQTKKIIENVYGSLVSIWNTSTDWQSRRMAERAATQLKPILFERCQRCGKYGLSGIEISLCLECYILRRIEERLAAKLDEEIAQMEHDLLYGDGSVEPTGWLNVQRDE